MSIMLCDLLICYFSFGMILPMLPGNPTWLNIFSVYGNLFFMVLSIVTLLGIFASHLYLSVECIYLYDLGKKVITSFFIAFLFLAALCFFAGTLIAHNWYLFFPLLLIFILIFIFRVFIFYLYPENRDRILILGITEQAIEIIKEAENKKIRGYDIKGFVTSLESEVGKEIQGLPVFGTMDLLAEIIKSNKINTVVITLRNMRGKLPVHELLQCKIKNIRILEGASFYETVKRKILIDDFFKPSWFIFKDGFYYTSLHASFKRVQGLIVSFILIVFLLPVFIMTALFIKWDSKGPVFYIQKRVGHRGRIFKLLKFRSMEQNAEKESGPQFASRGDLRVTRVGRIIRKIRIDEIPQLINIFKGDMDLVGPRPEREVFVKKLEKIVPYYSLRHSVRPGLTGWAQVNYPYGESYEDSKEKLKYDLYYVKHFSWYFDFQIFILTIREVVFGKGR